LEKLSQLKGLHSYFVKSVFDEDLIKVQNLMEHLEDFSLEEAEFEVSQELFGENINLFKLPDELTKLEFYKGLTRSKQDQILFVYNELCTNSCKAGQSLDFYADQARNNIKFNIPEDKKIKVVFKKAGNKLILEIVDQYGGLLYDDIKKIFNSNAILEVNRLTLGSGIGLNLVKLNSSCLMFKVKEDHYTRVTSIIDLKGRKKHHLDVFSFKIEKYGNQDE
jgi:light-regulated signal transduction histidine kinase (bacteriophytochrome)